MPSLSRSPAHSDFFYSAIIVAEDFFQSTNSKCFHVCSITAMGDTHDRDRPRGIGLDTIFFQKICICPHDFTPVLHQMINVMFTTPHVVPVTCTHTGFCHSYRSEPAVLECQIDVVNHCFTCLKNSPPRSVSNIQILPKSIMKSLIASLTTVLHARDELILVFLLVRSPLSCLGHCGSSWRLCCHCPICIALDMLHVGSKLAQFMSSLEHDTQRQPNVDKWILRCCCRCDHVACTPPCLWRTVFLSCHWVDTSRS